MTIPIRHLPANVRHLPVTVQQLPVSVRQLPATISQLPVTVGREDRLVRGCIALSLLLMAGFPVLASRGLTLITVGFVALVLYFGLTSALARDPLYTHFGIDTDAEEDRESSPVGRLFGTEGPAPVVDVRGPTEPPMIEPRTDHLIGS